MDRHERAYTRNFLTAMAGYAPVLVLSIWLLGQVGDTPWRFAIAILPVLPLIFAFRAYLRFLATMDELQQRIQLQAVGFAAGATAMITFTYGLLENAGLPRLSWVWVFPIICALWGGASWFLTRRYQ